MSNSLEPTEGMTLCQPTNLLRESLSTNNATRKRALQELKEMLESPTFIVCLTDSFHSLDPAQILQIKEFMEKLVHFMMAADRHPDVRHMICFVLKTIMYVVKPRHDYFDHLLGAVVQWIPNENEMIQLKSFAALSTVVEEFPKETTPYLGSLLELLLVTAFPKYKRKNIPKMYEVITILVKAAGSQLNKPELVQLLFPSLISQWDELQWNGNNNDELIPHLLMCISTVAKVIKTGCLPFCEPLFQRCISLLKKHPDDEGITLATLCLLSLLAGEMGAGIGGLIVKTNMRQLLVQNMQHPLPKIRRASFDLLYELTTSCLDQVIRPYLPDCMPILSENLIAGFEPGLVLDDDDEFSSDVSDKAFYILVEMVTQLRTEMQDYIELFLPQLLDLTNLQNEDESVAAIILGRLGLYCSSQVAPFLPHFFQQWCETFDNLDDGEMKESSLRGMCQLITANPTGISNEDFIFSFWNQVYPWIETQGEGELKQLLLNQLRDFKSRVGEQECNRLMNAVDHQVLVLGD